jgi:putative hydrolase of the HAD superfamily
MLLVSDLDDTFYEEITFVKSGFKAVVKYLTKKYGIETNELLYKCIELNKKGRDQIFNIHLKEYKLYSKREVLNCIETYRYHKPDIKLYNYALRFLKKFSKSNIYVVTNGNKI